MRSALLISATFPTCLRQPACQWCHARRHAAHNHSAKPRQQTRAGPPPGCLSCKTPKQSGAAPSHSFRNIRRRFKTGSVRHPSHLNLPHYSLRLERHDQGELEFGKLIPMPMNTIPDRRGIVKLPIIVKIEHLAEGYWSFNPPQSNQKETLRHGLLRLADRIILHEPSAVN